MSEVPKFILDGIDEDEYNTAGSKFITFPAIPPPKVGDWQFRDIICGTLDWDSPGKSMKLPVTVVEEGPDKGKEEKISFGVDKKGIWKGKEIYLAITGHEMPMAKGADGKNHPAPDPIELYEKPAIGGWQMQMGKKGGDPNAEDVLYPKLVSILAPGTKPATDSLGV